MPLRRNEHQGSGLRSRALLGFAAALALTAAGSCDGVSPAHANGTSVTSPATSSQRIVSVDAWSSPSDTPAFGTKRNAKNDVISRTAPRKAMPSGPVTNHLTIWSSANSRNR